MYISSFQVVWKIIRGRYNPRIVHFRTRLSSDLARTILANSITMTPGTITVDMNDDHLIVHWLDAPTTHSRYAGELIKDRMERMLARIWI
jgi:multicomponent Na+:H+ antiporter subunit E